MILDYYMQKQILTNWCWAAVTAAISTYYDMDSAWTQNSVATAVLNIDCSVVNPPAHPIECNQISSLEDALVASGNLREPPSDPLEFGEIMGEIDDQHPVACQITWEAVGRSHFVCIFGYDEQTLEIHIGDPESRVYIIPYDQFRTSYRGGQWTRSYLTRS